MREQDTVSASRCRSLQPSNSARETLYGLDRTKLARPNINIRIMQPAPPSSGFTQKTARSRDIAPRNRRCVVSRARYRLGMAAAPPPATPPSSLKIHSSASLKPSPKLLFSKTPSPSKPPLRSLRSACRSELRSFGDSQNWITVDKFPSADPIHIIHNSPSAASIQMAASASLDSAAKSAKKVCLFYCAETKPLAERVAALSDYIELRSITWRFSCSISLSPVLAAFHGISQSACVRFPRIERTI